jgi:hypothetical protein
MEEEEREEEVKRVKKVKSEVGAKSCRVVLWI